MGITIRFLSGSLQGREYEFEKDVIRVGDAADADVRIDPNQPDNGGARDRLIEIVRDGERFRILSTGNREISAQGDTAIDRVIDSGENVRFGAWGPIFEVLTPGHARSASEITAPIPALGEDSGTRRKPRDVRDGFKTPSGETPVGPKTVYMMIQDALGKAKEVEGGAMERGTMFIQQMVSETIHNSTKTLKLGLALMAGAVVIMGGILVYNVASTRRSLREASSAADTKVSGVKTELGAEVGALRKERDGLAKETETLTRRLSELEKTASGGQQAVSELRRRLADAEAKRRDLETRMGHAVSAMEREREALAAEKKRLETLERERAERERQEAERRARAEAEADARAKAAAERQVATPAETAPNPAPTPR